MAQSNFKSLEAEYQHKIDPKELDERYFINNEQAEDKDEDDLTPFIRQGAANKI